MDLFLDFVSPNYGKIRITEPEGFDAFSYNIKQGENRFGRDKSIGAKEIDLNFWDGYRFEKLPKDEWQISLNGTIVRQLSMQLERILEAISEKGSEAKIYFITSENGEEFVNGLLDIVESTTDELSYFKCSVVQDSAKALIERKKDIKADVYSNTDTFGNPQNPLPKTRILLRAQPFVQVSEWTIAYTEPRALVFDLFEEDGYNECQQIVTDGVENTLSFLGGTTTPDNFAYIEALDELTNIKFEIYDLDLFKTNSSTTEQLMVLIATDATFSATPEIVLAQRSTAGAFGNYYTITFPYMARGQRLYHYMRLNAGAGRATYNLNSWKVRITATSTSLDTVINGCEYFKFLKKGVKSLSGLDFVAPEIETGEFKDQFIASGNDLRQLESPLNFVFKDEMSDLKEINADYQINDRFVEAYTFPNFYKNIEIAIFEENASEDLERTFNARFKPKFLEYKYQTYEQDRGEKNTRQGFNTEAQFDTPNEQNQGKIEVSINHVRDSGAIAAAQKDASRNSTALVNDDKIFIIDCISIAPGSRKQFTALLKMQIIFAGTSAARLKILAVNFNWQTLGFKNGDTITITGQNAGSYYVLNYDTSVIELTPVTVLPTFQGEEVITFNYPITDVQWQSRAFEGFTDVSGLNGYVSNLKYSIKRNLMRTAWSSYLSSWNKDVQDGKIINTFFKQNGELTSRFQGGKLLKENADIIISELADKIISKFVYTGTLKTGFLKSKQLIEDTILLKGFIRIINKRGKVVKLHLKDMDANWFDGTMKIIGEARNESDTINIQTVSEGFVNVLETGYQDEINTSLDWYKITNGYVQLFDNKNLPLINLTFFTRISVNNVFYTDEILFAQALSNL